MDGCRRGWFAVRLEAGGGWSVACCETIEDLWRHCRPVGVMLVDIPIGLKEGGGEERTCDLEARRLLGRRASSVFRPPCRPTLAATSYSRALALNRFHTGKGISIQAFNITAKITEVDRFLECHPDLYGFLRETHPELCFAALHGRPMRDSKKKEQGRRQRREVLVDACAQAEEILRFSLGSFLRRDVAEDDILDALALAVVAQKGAGRLTTVPAKPETDSRGLPMEIVTLPVPEWG